MIQGSKWQRRKKARKQTALGFVDGLVRELEEKLGKAERGNKLW